ncbi:MAG: hypothetical protein QHH14_11320 [Clostridiales bacterium]|jgi:hypothetical protein|nr:hypothetical protein [Clostridiales bacterium]
MKNNGVLAVLSVLALLLAIPLGILLAFAYLGRIVVRLCEGLR